MNDNEMFVPPWAEKVFTKEIQTPLELTLLRQFFDAWKSLHSIKGDKRNPEIREKYETAAQELVDTAHAIKALGGGNG
jgi:hypothetical protein